MGEQTGEDRRQEQEEKIERLDSLIGMVGKIFPGIIAEVSFQLFLRHKSSFRSAGTHRHVSLVIIHPDLIKLKLPRKSCQRAKLLLPHPQ
jgi:hypothetical protein